MQDAGLEYARAYVMRMQNMEAQYIVTQPILYLCTESVQRRRMWVAKGVEIRRDFTWKDYSWWWQQHPMRRSWRRWRDTWREKRR